MKGNKQQLIDQYARMEEFNPWQPQEPYPNPDRNPGERWAFEMEPITKENEDE